MIIHRYKPVGCTNFGDALNDYLWPQLLNPRFKDVEGTFYGIGTVLSNRLPESPRHVVFGAGIGYYGYPTVDKSWKIYFVRGPHTARYMGNCPYITDPGILVKLFHKRYNAPDYAVSFLPRWDSINEGMEAACAHAGIHLIDARWEVPKVIEEIKATGLLLTEALHGAVVADALRVPWVCIYGSRGHEFKWKDWCASLDMVWNPIDAEEFTLTWARAYAVPQLSAESISSRRFGQVEAALTQFNYDLDSLCEPT